MRLRIAVSVGVLLVIGVLAAPAQASDQTHPVRVVERRTFFAANGTDVKTIGYVICARRYRVNSARVQMYQDHPEAVFQREEFFTDQVACTGEPDRFVVRFGPPNFPWYADQWVKGEARLFFFVAVCKPYGDTNCFGASADVPVFLK